VKLDELHVAQPAAGIGCQPHRVAGVLVAPRRRTTPDPRVPARREDHGVGDEHPAAAVVDAEPVTPKRAPVVNEQARDVDVVAHHHTELRGPAHERALNLPAGVVTREAGSPEPVSAEEALRKPAVLLTRELGPPADQVVDRGRRLAAEELHAARIAQPVALPQRVGGVLLPAVLRVHRAERRVDPSGSEHRVRVVAPPLADTEHLHAALRELDRGAQTGRARADDDHTGSDAPLLDRHH